jgi:hypothetical protein
LWWTVNSIPLCRLLDLKQQALSVLRANFRTVVSLDESRFTLKFADGSIRVWRRPGESCAEACAMPVARAVCADVRTPLVAGKKQS